MARISHSFDWRFSLADLLLRAGPPGMSQAQLTHSMEGLADADALSHQLEEWWIAKCVDRISIKGGRGRPKTVWRATEKLQEEYGEKKDDSTTH